MVTGSETDRFLWPRGRGSPQSTSSASRRTSGPGSSPAPRSTPATATPSRRPGRSTPARGGCGGSAHGPRGATASPVQASPGQPLVAVGYSQEPPTCSTPRRADSSCGKPAAAASSPATWRFPPGDGSLVTVSLDGVLRTWATRGSEQLRLQAPPDPAVDFTPDGRGAGAGRQSRRDRRPAHRPGRATVPRVPRRAACSTRATPRASRPLRSWRWLSYLDPARVRRSVRSTGEPGAASPP